MPRTAVAESPVTKIFAAVAGFLVFTFFFIGLLVRVLDVGGGGGRSGSFSISRHPLHALHDPRHALRVLHGRRHRDHHHRRGVVVEVQSQLLACLR